MTSEFEEASSGRMYNYLLGGARNFAVDRQLADRMIDTNPAVREWSRGNRRFLMRAVRYCAEQGIDQFLDLGSGIMSPDHVHGAVREIVPSASVAYVDVESVAVTHSREVLAGVDGATITQADVRDTRTVLSTPAVLDTIDFSRPVAIVAVAVVHFMSEESDVDSILAEYRRMLVPGSYFLMSHSSSDYDDPELSAQAARSIQLTHESATPCYSRDRDRIRELFGGLPLVDPGLVDVARWRSGDPTAQELGTYAGVAHLPY